MRQGIAEVRVHKEQAQCLEHFSFLAEDSDGFPVSPIEIPTEVDAQVVVLWSLSMRSITLHTVAYYSKPFVVESVSILAGYRKYLEEELDCVIQLVVTDNTPEKRAAAILAKQLPPGVCVYFNDRNIGLSAAHNQMLDRLYREGAQPSDLYLYFNPDVYFGSPATLVSLVRSVESLSDAYIVFPTLNKIYRSPQGGIFEGGACDSKGARLSYLLRHRHIRSRCNDVRSPTPRPISPGACFLMTLEGAKRLSCSLSRIAPFDERIFLYREMSALALRAKKSGLRAYHIPSVTVGHVRQSESVRISGVRSLRDYHQIISRFALTEIYGDLYGRDVRYCFNKAYDLLCRIWLLLTSRSATKKLSEGVSCGIV